MGLCMPIYAFMQLEDQNVVILVIFLLIHSEWLIH